VLYIGLIAFVAWRSWRVMLSRRALEVGLAAGVCAYGAQQLLLFPLAEIDPVWWVLAGVVVSVPASAPTSRRRVIVPAIAAATAVLAFVGGVLDVAADRLARTALRSTDRDAAIEAADRAVSLRPDNMRYRLVAAEARLDRGTLADIDRAIAESRRATDWSSKDPFAVDELATAMSRRAAVSGDPGDAEDALAEWRKLVDRDPRRATWQLQLGRAAALAGDIELARTAWTAAADLGEPGADELLAALDASS
jgi:tetratricopeptide (TPR) repeat protein